MLLLESGPEQAAQPSPPLPSSPKPLGWAGIVESQVKASAPSLA